MATAIYPCSKCGGLSCEECATNMMDQVKALKRRQDFRQQREADYQERAIKILYWISGQSGQPFDPEDKRAENAIHLVVDVLRYQAEVDTEHEIDFRVAASNDSTDRWAMLEFGDAAKPESRLKTALELAEERGATSWKKRR